MSREYILTGMFYNPLVNNPRPLASCGGGLPFGGVVKDAMHIIQYLNLLLDKGRRRLIIVRFV